MVTEFRVAQALLNSGVPATLRWTGAHQVARSLTSCCTLDVVANRCARSRTLMARLYVNGNEV